MPGQKYQISRSTRTAWVLHIYCMDAVSTITSSFKIIKIRILFIIMENTVKKKMLILWWVRIGNSVDFTLHTHRSRKNYTGTYITGKALFSTTFLKQVTFARKTAVTCHKYQVPISEWCSCSNRILQWIQLWTQNRKFQTYINICVN